MNLQELNILDQSAKNHQAIAESLKRSILRIANVRGGESTLVAAMEEAKLYQCQRVEEAICEATERFRDEILRHAELLLECKRREHAAKAEADRAILALHCPDEAPGEGATKP